MRALGERLKARAREEGAAVAGIAPVAPPVERDYYREWLREGRHGTMGYLERDPELRAELDRWFPGARSALICGFSYATNEPAPEPAAAGPHGRLARYAVRRDYHPVLLERMERLLRWVQAEVPGAAGRAFVDSSPVLEKAFARHAGVGWMGKNTMLIHPRLGSYFFLAGLALSVELEPDEPVPDHCGSCRRCLDACPTEAFPAPYRLDASRCIAYLTIEHRGPIPEERRAGIGDWVFGCDVCQEVCPWNRFSVRPAVPELAEEALPLRGPLREFAAMTPEAFKPLKETPLERARWRGWVRNALNAMGNSGDPAVESDLRRWAESADPVLSEQARDSLRRLGLEG